MRHISVRATTTSNYSFVSRQNEDIRRTRKQTVRFDIIRRPMMIDTTVACSRAHVKQWSHKRRGETKTSWFHSTRIPSIQKFKYTLFWSLNYLHVKKEKNEIDARMIVDCGSRGRSWMKKSYVCILIIIINTLTELNWLHEALKSTREQKYHEKFTPKTIICMHASCEWRTVGTEHAQSRRCNEHVQQVQTERWHRPSKVISPTDGEACGCGEREREKKLSFVPSFDVITQEILLMSFRSSLIGVLNNNHSRRLVNFKVEYV